MFPTIPIKSIQLRYPGGPGLRAAEFNSIVTACQKEPIRQHIDVSRLETILIKPHADIPAYSIFTITSGFILEGTVPTAMSQIITGPCNLFITNGATPLYTGKTNYCYIIGGQRAYLLRYIGTAPNVNQIVGVAPNTYTIAVGYEGLLTCSEPNNGYIWCIKHQNIPDISPPIWARTQENWRKNNSDPRVLCRTVIGTNKRTSSTVNYGETPFWVYLPKTNGDKDPNVVAGTNLLCIKDPDYAYTCISDYLDDKIGTVKMWAKSKNTIPIGWKLMDGIENVSGGTGFAFSEGTYPCFTNNSSNLGDVGGSIKLLATSVVSLIADHDPFMITGTAWSSFPTLKTENAHTHSTVSISTEESGSGTPHKHPVSLSNDGTHTHTITIPTPDGSHNHTGSTGTESPGTNTKLDTVTTDTGYADIKEPEGGHPHDLFGSVYVADGSTYYVPQAGDITNQTAVGVYDNGHTHSISSLAHSHTVNYHKHDVFSTGSVHTHTITIATPDGTHDHSGETDNEDQHKHSIAHTHGTGGGTPHTHEFLGMGIHYHTADALAHSPSQIESIDIVMPYLKLMFIERIDNSAGN